MYYNLLAQPEVYGVFRERKMKEGVIRLDGGA